MRAAASRDPKSSIRETARQFESLFMQEVMKSMRSNTMATGLLENSATQMGSEMLDTQFAGKMTGLPGGLSDAIARQLQRQMGVTDGKAEPLKTVQPLPTLAKKNVAPHVASFIQKHDDAAKAAHPQFVSVIAQGLYEKRHFPEALEFAKQIGMDADAEPNAVTNGGFERGVGDEKDTRFGWKIFRTDPKFDASGDTTVKHSGGRSLKVSFRTYKKAELYNIWQTVVVEPGASYKLSFWVRTENLKSGGGPQLLEAMNVGAIDIGTTGEAPPVFAQAETLVPYSE